LADFSGLAKRPVPNLQDLRVNPRLRTLATGAKGGLPQSVRTPTAWVSNIGSEAETLAVRFLLQQLVSPQLHEMITRYRGQGHNEQQVYFTYVAKLRQSR
jgi:hypothetical protein